MMSLEGNEQRKNLCCGVSSRHLMVVRWLLGGDVEVYRRETSQHGARNGKYEADETGE